MRVELLDHPRVWRTMFATRVNCTVLYCRHNTSIFSDTLTSFSNFILFPFCCSTSWHFWVLRGRKLLDLSVWVPCFRSLWRDSFFHIWFVHEAWLAIKKLWIAILICLLCCPGLFANTQQLLRIQGVCTRILANLSCICEVCSPILASSWLLRGVNTRKRANLWPTQWVYTRILADILRMREVYTRILANSSCRREVCTRILANSLRIREVCPRILAISWRFLELILEYARIYAMSFWVYLWRIWEVNVNAWRKGVEVLLRK